MKTYWKNRAFRYSDTFDIFQKCHNIGGIIVVCTSNVSRRCLLRRVPLCDIRCILELSLPSNPLMYHSHDRNITGWVWRNFVHRCSNWKSSIAYLYGRGLHYWKYCPALWTIICPLTWWAMGISSWGAIWATRRNWQMLFCSCCVPFWC